MSERVSRGAVRNTPVIERINHVSAEGIKEYASMELPRLVMEVGERDLSGGRLGGTKYKEVDVRFPG